MSTLTKIILTYQLHERGHMNKTETQALWRALCACTCKPGVNAPFDCVCVHDRVVYATNSYVMHRVEGLYQPGSVFKALFEHSIAYMDRARTFDGILTYDPDNRDFSDTCPYYDPAYIALALRPHKAAGSKNMQFHPGKGNGHAPLIITSTIATAHDPITITTAVQGMRKA